MIINLSYDYFLHPEKDGNRSLLTKEARIADAAGLLKNGVQIKLEQDGKLVSNVAELQAAIDSYASNPANLSEENSTTIKCRECKHPVSKDALKCPNCGAFLPYSSNSVGVKIMTALIFAIVGLVVLSLLGFPLFD